MKTLKWSDDDVLFLQNHYTKNGAKFCAEALTRSKAAIVHKANKLGLQRHIWWSDADILYLKLHYKNLGPKKCAHHLQKSIKAISAQAFALGLKYQRHKDITGKTYGNTRIIRLHSITDRGIQIWEVECLLCGKISKCNNTNCKKRKSCASCSAKQALKNIDNYTGTQYITGKEYGTWLRGAKIRNLAWFPELDGDKNKVLNFLDNLLIKQNFQCCKTGKPIICNSRLIKGKTTLGNASLDRINNKKPYTTDNVQFVTWEYNKHKREGSDEDFYQLCKAVIDYREHNESKLTKPTN